MKNARTTPDITPPIRPGSISTAYRLVTGIVVMLAVLVVIVATGCGGDGSTPDGTSRTALNESPAATGKNAQAPTDSSVLAATSTDADSTTANIQVTFVELGSVNCIPCKMMQPVMREIEATYGDRVAVVFHDVWTREGQPYAAKYHIKLIPTQVFLDRDGREFFRHEGYFPFEDIVKVLALQGVK